MSEKKPKTGGVERLAAFIVDKRNLFFLLYIFAAVFCVIAMNWTNVENDITTYLGKDTETRQGMDVMNANFTTYGTAEVMVSNVSYDTAEKLKETIEKIDGVDTVEFDDTADHYRDAAALFNVTFTGENDDPASEAALAGIEDKLAGYDLYTYSDVGYDQSAELQGEIVGILAVAVLVIIVVLTLTSRAYAEVPVLLTTFAMAALLNMGTNFLLGTISFISNSVAVILQLALAIDYAIILCHRYTDEHETLPARDACVAALSKAIPEISASSLTTVSGLGALGFMHFGIGLDLALVLVKAILFSLLSVFTLMPGLLMVFSKWMDKTRHKKLLPSVKALGRFSVKTRYVIPPVFVALIVAAAFFANKCPYCYTFTDLVTAKQNQRTVAYQKIKGTFGTSNMVAVIVPSGNYDAERALLKELDARPEVKSTMGLANIEAMDGYMLADALTPRQFSELAGMDYEVAEVLYTAYAVGNDDYGAIVNGLSDYKVPLFDMFSYLEQEMDDGNVTLGGEMGNTLNDLFDQLDKARVQLQSGGYSRLVVYLSLPEESAETAAFLDTMHQMIREYYPADNSWIVGNSTSAVDLASTFSQDNNLISVLTIVFVVLVLLFTFMSAGLPVLLILVIQGSVWINFAFPYLTGEPLYFLGYLIVSSIQMGANIDYAIVISNHYIECKKYMAPKEAIVEAVDKAFPTIFTSGSILTVAGFLIGSMTSNPVIATIGNCLGRGTLISIILVLFVLPQILVLGDSIIERTSFRVKGITHATRSAHGTMRVSGRVRGYVSGMVDAEITGIVRGQINASVSNDTTIKVEREDPYLAEQAGGTPPRQEEGAHVQ